jgi:hypothetical protein
MTEISSAAVVDTFAFLVLTVPCTAILTLSSNAVWLFLLLSPGCVWLSKRSDETAGAKNKPKDSVIKQEWLNWFEISKLLAGVVGIVATNMLRGTYTLFSHLVIAGLLVVNMLEAIIKDVESLGGWPNALVGLVLLCLIPFNFEGEQRLVDYTLEKDICVFPLSIWWVMLYTTWNAAFSYGFNFSWSTRFMLLTPLIVSLAGFGEISSWLSARTLSLVLNMVFRAMELTRLYTPGASFLTGEHNSHNPQIRLGWGTLNLIGIINFLAIPAP